jgi:MFS family permease
VRAQDLATPFQAHPRTRRLTLGAMFIDTLGGGLLAPFELVYAHVAVGLPLTTAGVALSIAAGAGLAIGPIAGAAVDRFGGTTVVAAANVLGALGCALLFLSRSVALFAAGSLLIVAGMRAFWGAFTPLVAQLAPARSLDVWFGRIRAARYLGLAAGEALAGAFLVAGTTRGLRTIVVADGASYLAAMGLILASRPPSSARRARAEDEGGAGGYRAALADVPNLLLAGLNVADTLLIVAPLLAMPVLVTEQLHLGTWLPGTLAALTTVVGATGMTLGSRMLRGRSRLRNLQLAALTWVLGLMLFVAAVPAGALAVPLLAVAMALLGLGEAFYAPTADALPAALAPPGLLGRYAAVHQMAWGVSEVLAPLLVGILLVRGVATTWIVLAALAGLTLGAYRILERVAAVRDRTGAVPIRGPRIRRQGPPAEVLRS